MKSLTRRDFVKTGLATALVGGCLSLGLKEALAQARKTGKPLLTAENLNRLFADEKANKALAAEAMRDIKGFIRRRFTLADLQSQQLEKLSKTDLGKLQDALKLVTKRGGSIRVSFSDEEKQAAERNHASSAFFRCKVDVTIKTPVGSAEVHVET